MLVVPPDAIAEIEIVADTRAVPVQNTAKRVRIVMITDSATNPFLAIEAHLIVELAFQAVPGSLRLGDVAESEGARGSVKIVALAPDGKKLVSVGKTSPGVTAQLSWDEGVVPDQWSLAVELAPPVESGPIDGFVEVESTGPQGAGRGRAVRVQIVGLGVPDVELRPARLVLLGLEAGTEGEVELVGHLAGQRLRVLSIRPDAAGEGWIAADALPLGADGVGRSARWRIHATLTKAPPTELSGTLAIDTDDAGVLSLPYAIAAKR
jgi:hypothetical protein